MPAFQYWISGAALWLAGSFIVTIIVAIIGVKAMIPNKAVFLLIGIAVLVLFVGWWTTAEQEESAAKAALASKERDREFSDMAATLQLIKESVVTYAKDEVANLSGVSNNQIRKDVLSLVGKMRVFENKIKDEKSDAMFSKVNLRNMTDDERHNQWLEQTKALQKLFNSQQAEFRSQYLPSALALRQEMLKRLDRPEQRNSDPRLVALDYGMLAGVSPVSDAADYLESLARQLPP